MKKLYFLGFLFLTLIAKSQVINFPDPVFKAKLLASNVTNNIAITEVWPPVNNQTVFNLKIDADDDGEITVEEASHIKRLNIENSNISSIAGFELFNSLESLYCQGNQITAIDLGDVGSTMNGQFYLYCENNQLTSVDFSQLTRPLFLYASNNLLTGFDFSQMEYAILLECSNNPISVIETGSYHKLIYLVCSNTPVTTIDISGNSGCEVLQCTNNPNLTSLMIKDAVDIDPDMGDTWGTFNFPNNPNLQYLCVSESRLGMAQGRLDQYGYINCALNAYCDFNPGMPFYTIQGNNKLDFDGNGCDTSDNPYPHLRLGITNGIVAGTIPSFDGNYSVSVTSGVHTITPLIENPAYFTVSPSSFVANFPSQSSPMTQNFCITPNGSHNDLEVTLLPLTVARPGFDANYKLICKNKGNTIQNATLDLLFDNSVSNLVSSSPSATNTANHLSWTLSNFQLFETREFLFTLNINSPTETPAVNGGDFLDYTATISASADETPQDNSFALEQIVVNSFDPNDKTCLEGNIVGPGMIGQYVHYIIRFENTGTFPAENIVVKDVIDSSKFDLASLVPISSSHNYVTRFLTGDKVEFIFENINLPFDDANNDGYVAFKIKTKPSLVVGDTFSNTASIYFDYNFPIVTNTTTTTIQLLGNPDFEFSDAFTLYPNPAQNTLNIQSKNGVEVNSISIYNLLGQLIQTETGNVSTIGISQLQTGHYFLKVHSDKGNAVTKFIKQ